VKGEYDKFTLDEKTAIGKRVAEYSTYYSRTILDIHLCNMSCAVKQ